MSTLLPLTDDLLSKVSKYHEGLHYYIIRNVSFFDVKRILKEIGLSVNKVITHFHKRKNYYTCQVEIAGKFSDEFILSGTEDLDKRVSVGVYLHDMSSFEFFVNKERGTFGRFHGLKLSMNNMGWRTLDY